MVTRTQAEIDEQLNEAAEGVDGGTKWPGMSYEDGVQNALLWVIGAASTPPMED
jgi:hypothetical protein